MLRINCFLLYSRTRANVWILLKRERFDASVHATNDCRCWHAVRSFALMLLQTVNISLTEAQPTIAHRNESSKDYYSYLSRSLLIAFMLGPELVTNYWVNSTPKGRMVCIDIVVPSRHDTISSRPPTLSSDINTKAKRWIPMYENEYLYELWMTGLIVWDTRRRMNSN